MYTDVSYVFFRAIRLETRISKNMTQTSTRTAIPRRRSVSRSFIALPDYNGETDGNFA
jgi:hypothetical protein